MKTISIVVLMLITANLFAQKPMIAEGNLPMGSWTFLAGTTADPLISEIGLQGKPYRKSILNLISDNKYEFTLDEYDAAGVDITQVKETGTYSFTSTQFTLQPKNSETIINPPSKKSFNSTAAKITANPLTPAVYNWQVEKNKPSTQVSLIITAIQPGFREGIFSSVGKSYRQLPAPKQKSIAHAM